MRKLFLLLTLFLVTAPMTSMAGIPGFMKQRMGTLSGQVVAEDGTEIPSGVVSFFETHKGIPPLVGNMHRIPEMVGRMGKDGKFAVKLLPGTYYMGALIITDPGRGPGPPREGEAFFFARDEKGDLLELTIGVQEIKDVGKVIGAPPESFPLVKNLVTIEGKLLKEDGSPFVGGVVAVKTDMSKPRPDYISERTGGNGKFSLKLPADTDYYLMGRERAVGRPVPGTFVGTYGSTSSISEGGALPIGSAAPARPASGMPGVDSMDIGPSDDLPLTIKGKPGETLTGIDIMMFKVPVPGEQREKLQGTLGFGDEFKEKMNKTVPLEESPEREK